MEDNTRESERIFLLGAMITSDCTFWSLTPNGKSSKGIIKDSDGVITSTIIASSKGGEHNEVI
jgi:hypothetical protein